MKRIQLLNKNDDQCISELYELQKASYMVEAELIGSLKLPPLKETKEDLKKSNDSVFGLLNEKNQLLGAIFITVSSHTVNINKLIISPTSFRNGFGALLVQHVLNLYCLLSVKVSTATKNFPARALYEKLGFTLCSKSETPEGIQLVQYYLQTF